ncbi:MAG: hypothetical protein KBS97_03675 [Firmicutes bacterium]|nr:hypothetical protein [Candidatus Fiminaster equi]
MTRVEKYRRYREEIANMKFETSSSKKTMSQQIGRMVGNSDSSKLNYEQVLDIFDSYDPDAKNTKKRHHIKLRKSQIIYWSVASVIIIGLLIGIIIVASRL